MNTIKTILLFLVVIVYSQSFVFAQDSLEISKQKAKDVIEKYIQVIGGREVISKVQDRTTIMRGTVMGQNGTFILKQKAPNKMRQEVKVGGMEQVTIFDGEKGIMTAMDQKIEVKEKELEAMKIEANMDFILDAEKYNVNYLYEGLEKFDNKDVHKIKMILPSGLRWLVFYDVESGYKVKEISEMQSQMGLLEKVSTFEDYKDVEGMMYPHKISISVATQNIDLVVSSIKVNKGLSDDIFVIVE